MPFRRPTPAAASLAPRDCVRQFPTLSPSVVQLVTFDSNGIVRARVELCIDSPDVDLNEWQRGLLGWVRRMYPGTPVVRAAFGLIR